VIGIPDPKWTERPLAFVVLKQGCDATERTIKESLQDYASKGLISRYAVPDHIIFVAALPKTSVGTIDKKLLREQAAKSVAQPT
jgi:fatty-acyl-CoA synthase